MILLLLVLLVENLTRKNIFRRASFASQRKVPNERPRESMYTKIGERRRMKSVELFRYTTEGSKRIDSLAISAQTAIRGRGVG